MARQSKADKALDKEIDKLYRENCSNIQISIFDIPKVFAVAKQARLDGKDMKVELIKFVESIRKN